MGSGGNVGVLESFVIYSTSDQRRALYDGRRAHTLAVTQHEALRVGKTDDRRTYVVGPQLPRQLWPPFARVRDDAGAIRVVRQTEVGPIVEQVRQSPAVCFGKMFYL